MTFELVKRRVVIHIAGFDGNVPISVHRRFRRDLTRFGRLWGLSATSSEPIITQDYIRHNVTVSSDQFSTVTEFFHLRWDDIVRQFTLAAIFVRIPCAIIAFGDFLFSGVARNYLRLSWQYTLFFLYPIFLFFSITTISFALGRIVTEFIFLGYYNMIFVCMIFVLLMYCADRWLYAALLFDDWIFSRQYVLSQNNEIRHKIIVAISHIENELLRDDIDEIIIVGHSLGATIAVDIVHGILNRNDLSSTLKTNITLITLAASILKIGLHPAAVSFRKAVGNVASSSHLVKWFDFQMRSDFMNFYGRNPVTALGFAYTGSPVMRHLNLRRLVTPARHKEIRLNLYKVHCQVVRANDRRAPFDYFMLTSGPLNSSDLSQLREGALSIFDADGRIYPT